MSPRSLQVEPQTVRLTSHGRARVRAYGHGRGVLCCGPERRWVWGQFDEWFVLERPGTCWLSLYTLSGAEHASVGLVPSVDFQSKPPARLRRLRFQSYAAPRLKPLTASDLQRMAGAAHTQEEDRS